MRRIQFFLILSCGLMWLGVLPAQGAKHPAGQIDLSPLPPEQGLGDLLNLDLRVYVAAKPIYCILVEKDRQRLRVLRHDGRLQVLAEYVAATGENFGPKEKEGDAKTPEGVYFITKFYHDRKVSVFGTRAFQLNYPNYFDLRAGRDGYGIFIHGTNQDLRYNSSNGCVTLNNSDLDRVADFLRVGTPVFIVPSLNGLQDDKRGYPNLAEQNFAGAKALLIPEASAKTDFASLYLIRILGQMVLIGEYWDDQGSVSTALLSAGESAAPQLAVAYLQEEAGNRWSVVDRGPIASGQRESESATIAGLPLNLTGQNTAPGDEDGFAENEEALPWQMTEAELYLAWYREAKQLGEAAASALEPPPLPVIAVPVASKDSSGLGTATVYGGLILATCMSLVAAWFFLRRQGGLGEGKVSEGGGRETGPVNLLRDEVKQAMGVLSTVQRRIDEEAMNVESLEGVQARMSALEETILTKQADIEELSAEQAILRSQGLADRSEQAAALSLLQRELLEVKEHLAEARQVMETVASREGMVHEQLAELRRFAESEAVPEHGVELQGVIEAFDGLRGQVQEMAEALQESELSSRQVEVALKRGQEGAVQASAEVVEALQVYATELKVLHAEMTAMKGATETSALDVVVQELRRELHQEQAGKLELMSQLGRLSLLEEELLRCNREHEDLRQESEESRMQAMAQKVALETTTESLRHQLVEMEGTKGELTNRLGRLPELETELAGREQEIDRLRQEGETRHAQTEAEKSALAVELASMQQELRQEKSVNAELSNRLVRISELEEELVKKTQDGEVLREESAKRQAEVVLEKGQLGSVLELLQRELDEERLSKSELLGRLVRMSELEEELALRDRHLASLRQANEAAVAEALAAKSRVESSLAEVVLARQVEVAHLSHALQEAKEKAFAEQETALNLTRQVEELQDSLRQVSEQQVLAQDAVVSDLRQEVLTLTAKVAELDKKALAAVGGVVMVKGSHYLPGDVLRKWIGKES